MQTCNFDDNPATSYDPVSGEFLCDGHAVQRPADSLVPATDPSTGVLPPDSDDGVPEAAIPEEG